MRPNFGDAVSENAQRVRTVLSTQQGMTAYQVLCVYTIHHSRK